MFALPAAAEPLLVSLASAFTQPTFQRALVLVIGAILAPGRHTLTHLLWTVRTLAPGHYSAYHRVLSRAVWALFPLAKILAAAILELIPTEEEVVVSVDDTNPQHKGPHVYGKGRHHDACRSTHSHVVWVWGHKWVVLTMNVRFPFASRPWALPVLAALYRPEELNRQEGRRHKTPLHLARQLVAVLIHWFPRRKFVVVGDGGYSSHELALFAHRHRRHMTWIGRFHPRANLFAPPPQPRPRQNGRPRLIGRPLAKPQQVVVRATRTRATVTWYGGSTRRIEYVTGTGWWYQRGQGAVPLRWVYVHDLTGTHRDEYFFSTDEAMKPDRIVSLYTSRWSIEVTFEEVRRHLGFASPRNWRRRSVLRTAPCLLGLFSVVSLIYHRYLRQHAPRIHRTPWYHKAEPTFSDALAAVRGVFWRESVFAGGPQWAGLQKLPPQLRYYLMERLCQAA